MASRKPKLAVRLSVIATVKRQDIWSYNARTHGERRANVYLKFIDTQISGLSESYFMGRHVSNSPELRYILIKRRAKGDGHVAVYEIDEAAGTVLVHDLFHTKQDWENQL